jgi:PAS domain S-box-containing protein
MSNENFTPEGVGDSSTPAGALQSPSARPLWEQERELFFSFFRLVNRITSLQNLIDEAINFLQHDSQCEAVAIRLRQGSDYPYFKALGFPSEFLRRENSLCSRDCFGEVVPDGSGGLNLECRCGDIICGRFDPSQPFFTAQGSFWTNDASDERLAASRPQTHRGRCSTDGYRSIALIPLRIAGNHLGLIQFNDKHAGRFTPEKIRLWEDLANHLAIAVARFRAEDALRASAEQTRVLLSTISDAIILNELPSETIVGRFLEVNDAFCQLLGYSHEEMLSMSPKDIDDPTSGFTARDAGAQLREKGEAVFDQILIAKDGVRIPVRIHACLFELHGQPAVITAVRDLSESKRAEFELNASRRQLRTALDAAKLGVWSRDLTTGIITGDALVRTIFGWEPGKIATINTLLNQIVPEDRARFLERSASIERAEDDVNTQYRFQLPGGAIRWISAWGNRVCNAAGNPILLTGVIQDITARKQAEKEMEELEHQFRHAQKMEAVGLLAGGIAHDFNNLLMVIRSYTEIMEDCLPPNDGLRRNTRAIMKAADRAASLTGQMLAFSRKQVLSPIALNLNTAVTDAAGMLRRLIGESIDLRVTLDESLWTVRADPDQVAQVLMNLCLNARDAMPRGGTLTITTHNHTAGESASPGHLGMSPGDYVAFSVADTGTGISQAMQERIFEPFFTTKSVGKGTGLGLSTVYGIVKQSGGYLFVESELGNGATFDVYLPRVKDAVRGAESPRTGHSVRGTETLLVVEDEDALRESICEYLASLGYSVLSADSGQQALDVAAQSNRPIDLLISDLVMPRMGGRELAQALIALRPALKTIFISGYTDDEIVRHGIEQNAYAFLQKPFRLAVLAGKLRDLLGPSY